MDQEQERQEEYASALLSKILNANIEISQKLAQLLSLGNPITDDTKPAFLIEKIRESDFQTRKDLSKLLSPLYANLGNCERCSLPWTVAKDHSTDIDEFHSCFPLCERCWNDLSIDGRISFYKKMYESWGQEDEAKWEALKKAVLEDK